MDYRAVVKFFTADEGGRRKPAGNGYRPHAKMGDEYTTVVITSDVEIMELGKDYEVQIEFLCKDEYSDKIHSGLNLGLFEGSRPVGHGYIK